MRKLINSVQHYAWGSHTALTSLYGIPNPDNLPMAELWMGAHPKSSSRVVDARGNSVSLRDEINATPDALLGKVVASQFGELPFLFKILCAAKPLSIQVHPGKAASVAGFARENVAGIALGDPQRNYKDANHKPELVYALTPFLAMNAFREFTEAAALLAPVARAHPLIDAFCKAPDAGRLKSLFAGLLALEGDEKDRALSILYEVSKGQQGKSWDAFRSIAAVYPRDNGLFSPLLLNVVELAPGQAMFLSAETPHAYLNGVALEVMANSDNVLRAGLTPKHIDIPELLDNVRFTPRPASRLLIDPVAEGDMLTFPVPVNDFTFSVHQLHQTPQPLIQPSAAIVLCTEGEALLTQNQSQLGLQAGESAFIGANEPAVTVSGRGRLARVYNQLK